MKKLSYIIVLTLILGLVLTGCTLLSNIGQVPTSEQSGIAYLTKNLSSPVLVGLWHFDEGVGTTANDSSVNSNDGTLHNFVPPHGWVSGMFGQALSFDGVDDYVLVDNTSNIAPSSITVEAWVKQIGTPGTCKYIISKYYVLKAGAWSSYAFYTGSTGGLYFYIGGETTYKLSPNAGTGIWDGEWHHIAGTFDDASDILKLYVDGILVPGTPSGTAGAIGYDTGDLYFGTYRFPNGRWCFSGTIDQVRIWDGALTESDIEYNYSIESNYLSGNVGIDIKPGSDPNSINLGSNGVVPVAILGSADFDAATANPSTVTLAGAGVRLKGKSGNVGSLEDVNSDGYLDLVVQVYTNDLTVPGDGVIFLTAYTYDGLAISGIDEVRIVQPK